MNNRQLATAYRVAEGKHARLWESARAYAQTLGHPNPLQAAYEATTATRLEVQELAAAIESRTAALSFRVPIAGRVDYLAASPRGVA